MIEIAISNDFSAAGVTVALGCISCRVTVEKTQEALRTALDAEEARRLESLGGRPASEVPEIAAARRAYRALGKDPARYRVSSEALMRRLIRGQGIYRINTVVDTNNLVSLRCGHSIGAFRVDALSPPILFRKAMAGETYEAIGRGPMNLENLPVFSDCEGAFGSPTSDSERSMITLDTENLLMAIIAFGDDPDLPRHVDFAAESLGAYCAARDIETAIVRQTGH